MIKVKLTMAHVGDLYFTRDEAVAFLKLLDTGVRNRPLEVEYVPEPPKPPDAKDT